MTSVAEVFVGLLLAVAVLALLARRLHIPYPILFVVGGLLLGLVPTLPKVRLDPELVFLFFLPPLLFPAALFTSWRDFRANLRSISLLAVGLVLFTTVSVAILSHYLMGLPMAVGLVLGAIISPPDAIAATAIANRLRVPRRLVTILEGESLVNDATALVAYRFATLAVATGSFSLTQASVMFLWVGFGGIGMGLLFGWLAAKFHQCVDDAPIEITVSLLTPFAAYLSAERLEVSGVLAVVTAGLYLGRRMPDILTFQTRLQGGPVWDMVEFLLNGFVFILIGLQLPEILNALTSAEMPVAQVIGYALAISVAVILIRIVWVFPASYLPRLASKSLRQRDPYPRWQNVALVAWTGMRGVVSLAAALALPLTAQNGQPFPARDLIIFITFVVILVTLVVQGVSLPPLIRLLGIKDDGSVELEERNARLTANRAALTKLDLMQEQEPEMVDALRRLRAEYQDHLLQLEGSKTHSPGIPPRRFSSDFERLSHEALLEERRTIVKLRDQDIISDEVLRHIQRDIDLAEARLGHHS
jgi:Na+/H+ antiporter